MNENRYLCFNLGKEEFAIPLLDVREVIGVPETTPVPQAPSHFVGIMNLRGKVLSVMDLRVKLGVKPQPSPETAVVILDIGDLQLGVIVDCINSVQAFPQDMIDEKPVLEGSKLQDTILGVVRREDRLVLLLNVAKAMSMEDRAHARPAQKAA